MSRELLDREVAAVRQSDAAGGISASRVGTAVRVSRVTARRYLQHPCDAGLVEWNHRLGGSGRPEILFCWK